MLEAVSGCGGLPWVLRLWRRENIIIAMTELANMKRHVALDEGGILAETIEPAGVLIPQKITATSSRRCAPQLVLELFGIAKA